MASPLSSSSQTKLAVGTGKDEVYVAATPLRATKGPAQVLMSAAYSLKIWDLQHFMIIVKPSSRRSNFKTTVFDFQPQDPEDIYVAVAALCGQAVPGTILTRKIKKLPRTRCWLVGISESNALEAAYEFNSQWNTDLRIGHHDCRHYTNGLAELLTGEKNVLKCLKKKVRVETSQHLVF